MEQRKNTWTGPGAKTLFYQGFWSSQTQLAKYTGQGGFIATTGEHVTCTGAMDAIYDPFIGCELDEVRLRDEGRWSGPIELALQTQTSIANWWNGIRVEKPSTRSTGTLTVSSHSIDFSKVSIAQGLDIANHKKRHDALGSAEPTILYGVSRGAATTFSAFALHKYSNVKLVVLEGCFYDICGVFEYRYGRMFEPCQKVIRWMFPSVTIDGPSPAAAIESFPPGVPVLFITSKVDTSVPCYATELLAKELAMRELNPVYLLVLEKSSHPNYMCDDQEDKEAYVTLLHALYKQYGLPYIESMAQEGEELVGLSKL